MRYSGAVVRWAQSSLTAPLFFVPLDRDGQEACHPKPYTIILPFPD